MVGAAPSPRCHSSPPISSASPWPPVTGPRLRVSHVRSSTRRGVSRFPASQQPRGAAGGLVDADADLLVRAAERLAGSPRTFEHAQACEAAAAELARAGRHSEAKALFDAAIDAFDEIGAQRAAASALASARGVGIGRKRPAYGWEALTPSEIEVVSLAADGLTNPEVGRRLFISRRKVQTHLSSAFGKLEITSRVELAALVTRRGRGPDERDESR